jgi:hypothetical protein
MANPQDIILEGSTATWDMGIIQGDVHGTYSGTFKFRCFLTPTQNLAAAREYRELLGPQLMLAPESDGHTAFALTQCKYRILSSPPFWTAPLQNGEMPGNIPDLNVILAVLDAAISSETKYRALMTKERDKMLTRAIGAAEAMAQTEDEQDE